MLRIGLSSSSAATRRLASASASRSSSILGTTTTTTSSTRFSSSKPADNDSEVTPKSLQRPEATKQTNSEGGADALRSFFEKRRAVLQKEEQEGATTTTSTTNRSWRSKPVNNNENEILAKPLRRVAASEQQTNSDGGTDAPVRRLAVAEQQTNSDGGTDALRVFFEKRRAALQKEQQPQQRQQQGREQRLSQANQQRPSQANQRVNNNNYPNQNPNRETNNKNNQSNRPQQQSNPNNRRQQQPRRQQANRGPPQESHDTSRLAELIQQLRRDAPAKAAAASTVRQPQTSPPQEASSQPAWRQRFQQRQTDATQTIRPSFQNRQPPPRPPPPPSQDTAETGGGDGASRREQRNARRIASQPRHIDFLQGRLGREEDLPRVKDEIRTVRLPNGALLSLTEASILYRIKIDDIKRKLRSMGERVSNGMTLDNDLMELLALDYGIETVRSEDDGSVVDAEQLLMQQRRVEEDFVSFPPRPPVVCIMGHVDHGKTTLMDALRRRSLAQQQPKSVKKSKGKKKKGAATSAVSDDVAGTEAGGITQVISAFQVELEEQDTKVTFLDTPGHAAFKAMRQSGSHAADVIVLVIAADDGVSEQTIEILEFYKSIVKGSDGGISMVVAMNKIDKPGVDVEEAKMRIENQLLEHGIITEGMAYTDSEYGTPVQVIPTSGLSGLGLDDLMEGLILQSEVMDLRADAEDHGEGIVMDARVEKGLGVVADCIIRWGNIQPGDVVVSGTQIARVKMLKDGK
jgi:translation initiation factor IF-2